MNFTNTPPDWTAEGTEPSSSFKSVGFFAGFKPPAAYFNWFWTKVSKCLQELQKVSAGQTQYSGTTAKGEIFNDYTNNNANGVYSHASGFHTKANDYQFATGRYNSKATAPTSATDTTGSLFIVGCGTSTATANALRISTDGKCYGSQSFCASGAGLSELYEWQDGNLNNEDRRGLFITLDGDKIRIATPQDDYVLGVIDPCPFIVGDVQSEAWKDMYLKDVFGERLTETVNVPETIDKETGQTIPAHTETHFIINPNYDPKKAYISRDKRSEFTAITSKGKVVMIDDGTCKVNKYCTVGKNGVATASENNYAVRVLERIDDTHIRVYIDSVFVVA